MNIIEAIKSGRRFRRKGWLSDGIFTGTDWVQPSNHHCLRREDIIVDDWEVESEAVTITEQQFNLAVQRTLHQMDPDEHGFWDKLRKNLGL